MVCVRMLVGCHIVLLCLACRRHLPAGQISSASGQGCLATAGGDVALVACDGAAAWEAQPNGQLKLAGAGSECLSQEGAAAGSGPSHNIPHSAGNSTSSGSQRGITGVSHFFLTASNATGPGSAIASLLASQPQRCKIFLSVVHCIVPVAELMPTSASESLSMVAFANAWCQGE